MPIGVTLIGFADEIGMTTVVKQRDLMILVNSALQKVSDWMKAETETSARQGRINPIENKKNIFPTQIIV